jgi:nuclear receptor subfamily 1 group D protein 2
MSKSPYVDPHKSGHEIWEEFSLSFTPAVKEVVEFAKRIPGFRDLSQHDQVNLLKAGTFEVGFIYLQQWARACSVVFSVVLSFFSK